MKRQKLSSQAGVTLLESIVAIVLLTTLSLMAFNSLLSGTMVYGDRLQAYEDLGDTYSQIEGVGEGRPIKASGVIAFKYGTSDKVVEIKGDYTYGLSEEGDQVVLANFIPKVEDNGQ